MSIIKPARNFNPMMATAANIVIAEVDEIVEPGELSPEELSLLIYSWMVLF